MVSVVIPARNEEEDITESLNSVLTQSYINLEVIIINDHSTDKTQEIIEAIAANDSRVTVINDPELHCSSRMAYE